VTHDKTWLPARLQPPKLSDGVPYSVYLVQYEQYLDALQHMKRRFLETRRFDPKKLRPVVPSLGPVSYPPSGEKGAILGMITSVGLTFGSIPPPLFDDGNSPPSAAETARFKKALESIDTTPAAPLVKNVPTPAQIASRKAHKRARRKARVAAKKLEQKTAATQAQAEHVSAQVALVTASGKLLAAEKRLKKKKPESPARKKRREARAAARKVAPDGVPPPVVT